MNDSDIWSHSHRMYLIGENSISFPWYIPKDFPNKALGPADKERLIKFIKTKQLVLDWSDWEKNVYYLFRIFFPPLASVIHQNFRRKHFNALQDAIYSHFDSSFWDERKSKTLRLSTSKYDKQLAYIDFLDYNKSKQNYIGPKLPIALMLAGNGTYENPYTLNFEDDPLAKSLVYLDKQGLKTKLPIFLENLNTLLAKLSFYKLNRQCMKDLSELLEWID